MSYNIIYKRLINLSADDDLLKKVEREIRIISFEDQSMVMEISACMASKNNSILIDFLIENDAQKIEVEMTCKVTDCEINNGVSRISLKLIQYNKKEWTDFRNLLLEKQNDSTELLKVLRGR